MTGARDVEVNWCRWVAHVRDNYVDVTLVCAPSTKFTGGSPLTMLVCRDLLQAGRSESLELSCLVD
jgi:hypothetical protein